MKNLSILIFAILGLCFNANAADNYKVGDTLYVWAPSGLNVRTGPSTHYGKMGKLQIGDYVIVKGITEKQYITNGLSAYGDPYGNPDGKAKHPYQLRGKWIEVDSDQFYGYLVDIYLLKMPYETTLEECLAQGDLENMESNLIPNGDFYKDYAHAFPNGFAVNDYSGEGGGYEELVLPGFTIEEGYVFANVYYNLEEVSIDGAPHWFTEGTYTDKLHLSDDGICAMSFTLNNGILVIEYSCYC